MQSRLISLVACVLCFSSGVMIAQSRRPEKPPTQPTSRVPQRNPEAKCVGVAAIMASDDDFPNPKLRPVVYRAWDDGTIECWQYNRSSPSQWRVVQP